LQPRDYKKITGIFTFLWITLDDRPSAKPFADHASVEANGAIVV
jgi:hypothetical protein